MFYTDIMHVPKKFARYVGWNIRVLPRVSNLRPKKALEGPFCKYFVQPEGDEGHQMLIMRTDIKLDEVRRS